MRNVPRLMMGTTLAIVYGGLFFADGWTLLDKLEWAAALWMVLLLTIAAHVDHERIENIARVNQWLSGCLGQTPKADHPEPEE